MTGSGLVRRVRHGGRWVRLVVALNVFALSTVMMLSPAAPASAAVMAKDLGTLGGASSTAMDVSGDIVVGYADTGWGPEHAFAYDLGAASPKMIDLGVLSGMYSSVATAVSGKVVVGYSNSHAFAYDLAAASPKMVDLGTLRGRDSLATAVSGKVVVGVSDSRAFAYDLGAASPRLIDLGALGGGASYAEAVDGTIVVGWSRTATRDEHAFVYDLAAPVPTMRDLGTLPGKTSCHADDVSGTIVVGYCGGLSQDGTRGFAVDLAANPPTMIDLGTLGGDESEAYAVSGKTVAGRSLTATGGVHAFTYDLAAVSPVIRDLGDSSQGVFTVGISGHVVAGNIERRGFVYDLDAPSPSIALGTLGGTSSSANAVNGRIVVGAASMSGNMSRHATAWRIPTATTTTVTSSANPTTGIFTVTARITPTPDGGTVNFAANGTPWPYCQNMPVVGSQATCEVGVGGFGGKFGVTITATYSGTARFAASGSPAFTEIFSPVPCASLAYCDLTYADLTNANLAHANLSGSDLTRANLTGATTTGADFTGVVWSDTTCPDRTNSNAHNNTCPTE
jgi:probable HAF family extracellular repeat protein